MNKINKFIVIILAVFFLCSAIYSITTDDIMLIYPKEIFSNYKSCQNSDYVICTENSDSSTSIIIESKYIDSNNGYDYYTETLFNENSDKYNNYFVKKNSDEIIAVFNLNKLDILDSIDSLNVDCGYYRDGYLYFTIKGINSIFYINDCMKNCNVYFTPQRFGEINTCSFCIAEDYSYYITNTGNLAKYDGANEELIKELPKLSATVLNENYIKERTSEFDYYLNIINGVFYYGACNNLFYINENGEVEYLDFKIPKTASDFSGIYRIEPCKYNEEMVAVSYLYYDVNTEYRSQGTVRYLINPKTGHRVKYKQKRKNQCRELSDNDFLEYVDILNSKAIIAG